MDVQEIIEAALRKDERILKTDAVWREGYRQKIRRTRSCHLWQGVLDRKGYGIYNAGNFSVRAHRVALLFAGELSTRENWVACHYNGCENKHCVNPSHLYWGTPASNVADVLPKLAVRDAEKIRAMPMRRIIPDNVIIEAWNLYYTDNLSAKDVGARLGISGVYVQSIVKRRYRAALTATLATNGKTKHRRTYASTSGERQSLSKLTEAKVQALREDICAGIARDTLARKYGVSKPNISQIAIGATWSHLAWPKGLAPRAPRGSQMDSQTQGQIRSFYTQGTYNTRQLSEKYGKSINAIRRVLRSGGAKA